MKTTNETRLNPTPCPICGSHDVGLYEKRYAQDPDNGIDGLVYTVRCSDCHVEVTAETALDAVRKWSRYGEGRTE